MNRWNIDVALRKAMTAMISMTAIHFACAAAPLPFEGEKQESVASGQEVYMMLSAYKIVPYSPGYLENTLAAFGRTEVTGILYTALGGITRHLAERWPKDGGKPLDEVAYNREIYHQAKALGAKLWLQVPEYYNHVEVNGEWRLVTASEILKEGAAREALKKEFQRAVAAYSEFAGRSARIILFEEAGIYHSPQGGGTFWASPDQPPALTRSRPGPHYNELFSRRMKGVFVHFHGWAREIHPDAAIGMHLGHSAVEDGARLKEAVHWLDRKGARPDFIFYDFYLGSQSPRGELGDRWANYRKRLTGRRANLAAIDSRNPVPALYLGQLHTMNNFQHGRGYTPTRDELDRTLALSDRLHLDFQGVGYYTKNALPTDRAVSPEAFDPNARGATTAAESSTDRWDYGLSQLFERRGVRYRDWFDLVLYGRFRKDGYRVYARRADTGEWQLIGRVARSLRPGYRRNEAVVLRFLHADEFLHEGRTSLTLKLEPVAGLTGGTLESVHLVPSQPAGSFRSAATIRQEIESGEIGRYSRGTTKERLQLGEREIELTVRTAAP